MNCNLMSDVKQAISASNQETHKTVSLRYMPIYLHENSQSSSDVIELAAVISPTKRPTRRPTSR